MLNVLGLILLFIDAWLFTATFSSTLEPNDRTTLYIVIPFWTLLTIACFYIANRRPKTTIS